MEWGQLPFLPARRTALAVNGVAMKCHAHTSRMMVEKSRKRLHHRLNELCIGLGVCLPPDRRDSLITAPPPDVDAFTDVVFAAEGLEPTSNRRLCAKVGSKVAGHVER